MKRSEKMLRSALLLLAIWTLGSVLLAVVLTAQEGLAFAWSFRSSALQCAVLGVVVAPAWWGIRRLPSLPGWVRWLALSVGTVALSVSAELIYDRVLAWTAGSDIAMVRRQVSGYWAWLQMLLMTAVAVFAMVASQTASRLRLEERRAAQLRLLMREAELRALRAQLRPHFLFNALNSIYSLIPDRPDQAAAMVSGLSDLMRETLEVSDRSSIPLEEELSLMERYLEIESVRFGDRLRLEFEIDPSCRQALVPPLLLQPLVENAVRHGLAPSESPVTIGVRANRVGRLEGDSLEVVVVDDGGPRTHTAGDVRHQEGNGLRIVRSRLESEHAEAARFEAGPRADQRGFKVEFEIPYRLAGALT